MGKNATVVYNKCICVDFRELNKKTMKNACPLPLLDEVQDQLAGSTVFSTLDLQTRYWQMPVSEKDQDKTAFCSGPRVRLFQFRRMPFGLTGVYSSFQCLMGKVLRGLPFVKNYIDDILLMFSSSVCPQTVSPLPVWSPFQAYY